MADPRDADLVGATRAGNPEAYGTLVSRYQGHVYGLAYSLVGNWADAQDIAQETFIRAYLNLDQLKEPDRFAPWLRRVTFSVAMNWLKAFRPDIFRQLDGQIDLETLEIPDFRPGPAEELERHELAEAVHRAIASLPPKYRVPLTMFHLDGLSYQKVAEFLDLPVGNVKVLIHRARTKLKALLSDYVTGEVGAMVQEVFDEHKLPLELSQREWGIDPKSLPAVLTPEAFPPMPLGSLQSIHGFAGKDLAAKDMTRLPVDFIADITFDEATLWPLSQHLPSGFSPTEWMETAKSPGLGVRSLHQKGITGKGVSVAVFDKPIRPTHVEFQGRMHYYKVAAPRPENDWLHFHGAACASILAGRTCGVAPEAELFYFAVPDNGQNARNYVLAIEDLVQVNESLPEGRKIRLVSISDGFAPGSDDEALWGKLVERAEAAGVMLISSNRLRESSFVWGGCAPYLDRDDPREYKLATYVAGWADPADVVLIPSDYRATAANRADDSYTYWGGGGFSWAIAYAAGLFALALSIAPALSYAKIAESLVASKTPCRDGAFVVDPVRFVEAISPGCA